MGYTSDTNAWELAEIERQLQENSILDNREYQTLCRLSRSRDERVRQRASQALQKAALGWDKGR